MKFITFAPHGVLEIVTILVGYTDMCLMIKEDPDLFSEICDAVGSKILRYYECCLQHSSVGAAIVNDDWGFNQQTMISPSDLRKYIIPWHRRIVQTIHQSGRPAILHSCGNLREIWPDIIDDIHYDAKHSFEDNIQSVEAAYEEYGSRIAILGGIDVDFLCRSDPMTIRKRVRSMLDRSSGRGGYAVGSGNSIADYVPLANYLAMIDAAN